VASTRSDLQRIGMRNDESVKEYVYTPLLENELNFIFIKSLKTPYYDYLTSKSLAYFMEVITTAERVKQGLKLKRIWNSKKKGLMLCRLTNEKITLT